MSEEHQSRNDLPRRVGFFGATSIMIGIMIGSGIFQTPPGIAGQLDNTALILALWIAGGLLSLCGALTWAELATMFPRSGGVYVFLHEGLGPVVAFVFGWTYMLLTKPAAAAAIAVVFAEHVHRLLGVESSESRVALTTCATLVSLTIINTFNVRVGSGVSVVLTALKIVALLAIVGLAACVPGAPAASQPAGSLTYGNVALVAAVVSVMSSVLWTYDGWSDVGAIAGEVQAPQRTLPRVFFLGTVAVILLYVAVNGAYFHIIPLGEMRQQSTVAPLAMQRLLGAAGDTVVTLIVIVSTLGSTHGSIITGARVTFAQARDGLLFRSLGHVWRVSQTPAVSLWVQAALCCLAVLLLRSFQNMIDTFNFTMWIFYGLAGASVIILRIRRPEADRPYRCWGYPLVPLLFVASAAGITGLSIYASPATTLPWLGVLAAGVPAYYLWRWATSQPTSGR